MIDWRLPENRREAFQRLYSFHLRYKSHPGMVYSLLPAIADHYGLDNEQRSWLVWLNGNTQNPAMSLLLGEASDWSAVNWMDATLFWDDNFKLMEWDTDRRHQKGKFGEATEKWYQMIDADLGPQWTRAKDWSDVWKYSFSQPYMGRLSAWSMAEYAKILLPGIPDADTLLLRDKTGSQSHRNGLCIIEGYDAAFWDWKDLPPGMITDVEMLGLDLLEEAIDRNPKNPDVGYLTLESALCTFKSMWKPNRRYPGVYADMAYNRIKKAEERFGKRFDILWEARQRDLPEWLRLEDSPGDPGLVASKQNHFRETGEIPVIYREWDDMEPSAFDLEVSNANL